MGLRASELRHVVQIQHSVEQRDEYNAVSGKAWTTFKTVNAKISGYSAKDLIAAKAAGSETTARLKMRKRNDVDTSMRVKHGANIYEIISPPQPDDESGNIYMTLLLKLLS